MNCRVLTGDEVDKETLVLICNTQTDKYTKQNTIKNNKLHFVISAQLILRYSNPITGLIGPEGSRRLKFPDFKTIGT